MASVAERVRKMVGKVSGRSLVRSHPLIVGLLEEDDRRRERQRGSSFDFSSEAPLFDSPFERRRLRVLDRLFLALQRHGFSPWVKDKQAREVGVQVGHHNVGFSLDRVTQRLRVPRSGSPHTPTTKAREKLRLTILPWDRTTDIAGKYWEDAEGTKIEDKLTEIVVELIVTGEAHYRRAAQAYHDWWIERRAELEEKERRRKEEEERLERERLAKLEAERLERLFTAAGNWRRAADLRAFVGAVKEAKQNTLDPLEKNRLERWVSDALAAADRLDPLREGHLQFEMAADDSDLGLSTSSPGYEDCAIRREEV
jgi:hypothetical protein